MKQLILCLAIGLFAQPAFANPVIDDFSTAVTPNPLAGGTVTQAISVAQALGPNIDSSRTVTTSGLATTTIGSGGISLTTFGLGETLLLNYSGISAPISLVNGFLRTNFFGATVTGTYDVLVTLSNGGTTSSVTKSIGGPVVSSLHRDYYGSEFSAAVSGSVDGINILFTQTSGGIGSFSNGAANLQAIPEPSSYILLGLTGVVGFVAFRRRRVSVDAA